MLVSRTEEFKETQRKRQGKKQGTRGKEEPGVVRRRRTWGKEEPGVVRTRRTRRRTTLLVVSC